MKFDELDADHKLSAKQDYLLRLADKGRFIAVIYGPGNGPERDPSYGELSEADRLVDDETMRSDGVDYVPDDFEREKMKRWIVTVVDSGDTCDGKARVLAVCKTEEGARAFIRNDMEERVDDATDDEGNCTYDVVDFDKMSLSTYNGISSCEWNVEEIEFD